jgi:biotin transport system substrate-specific component
MLFMAMLTAAAAQFSITLPFTAVPLTLQPMVVLVGGLALGSRLALGSQIMYLAAGALGLPVFAPSAVLPQGALRLLGPTGGYLLSYPAAAFMVGYLAERGFGRRYATSVLAMLPGLLAIYSGGAAWLAILARDAGQGTVSSVNAALASGVYPFVIADLAKLAVAAAVLPAVWRLVDRGGGSS